jgi:hypothetical protein
VKKGVESTAFNHIGFCFSRHVCFCTFLLWNYIVALYGPR